jgi:hypothetical protein
MKNSGFPSGMNEFRTDPTDLFGIKANSKQIRQISSESKRILNRSVGSLRNRSKF